MRLTYPVNEWILSVRTPLSGLESPPQLLILNQDAAMSETRGFTYHSRAFAVYYGPTEQPC